MRVQIRGMRHTGQVAVILQMHPVEGGHGRVVEMRKELAVEGKPLLQVRYVRSKK